MVFKLLIDYTEKDMKDRKRIFIVILILCVSLSFSKVFATNISEYDYDTDYDEYGSELYSSYDDNSDYNYITNNYYIDGYRIDSYNVDMNVDKYGVMNINETITVDASRSKHGIIRSIPTKNTVKRNDGTSYTNHARITNVKVNDEYEKSNENKNLNIKIGDPHNTFTGKKTYVISYTYDIGNDKTKDYDELYYNIIGTEWNTRISNVSFKITMPKEFDSSKLGFSVGEYGTVGYNDIKYSVDSNVITGSYLGTLNCYEGLTVRCELPEGYFEKKPINVSAQDIIIIGIAATTAIIGYLVWSKYGRDKKIVETVEFYPPEGLSSLDVGYFYYGNITNNQIVSLLISLANKGYIRIEENKEKKGIFKSNDYKIYPLEQKNSSTLEENSEMKQNLNSDANMKENNLTNEEKIFYKGLLRCKPSNADYITKKDLQYDFYREANKIKASEKKKKKLIISGNKKVQMIVYPIIMIALMLPMIILCRVFNLGYEFSGILQLAIWGGVFFTSLVTLKNVNYIILPEFLGITTLILYTLLILFNIEYGFNLYIMECLLIMLSLGLNSILCALVTNRTDYGVEIKGKIGGFKNFLETAEKDKLEALVNENPQYFYNILPYTYALNVSSKWIEKFKDITMEPPSWYYYDGTNPFNSYLFIRTLDRSFDSFEGAMVSTPESSSSSGGFSGGGFSGGGSGGGGGSSW